MRKAFKMETATQQSLNFLHLIHGNYQVQVKADQRLRIGIDTLAVDDAITDLALRKQGDQAFEEVRFIPSHSLPEGEGLHTA